MLKILSSLLIFLSLASFSQAKTAIVDIESVLKNSKVMANTKKTIEAKTASYQKIITKYDSVYDNTTIDTVVIDEDTYNTLPDSTTQTYTLPSGSVTITTTRHAVNLYEHEMNVNESKRNIKLLNAIYVDQLEREFESLMGQ